MGIFTGGNRVTGTVEPLAEATGYRGTIGAAQALIENVQNDRALFNAIIETDFQEVNMLREGADIEVLTEASILAMGAKIKEFLKNAWEKIKSLISSFITMITTVIIRDNKQLVNKYRTAVIKKNLSKMNYKWSECKQDKDKVFPAGIEDDATNIEAVTKYVKERLEKVSSSAKTASGALDAGSTEIKSRDFKEGFYRTIKLDIDDLNKSMKELYYKDVDKIEGLSDALLRNIMFELEESKNTLKSLNTAKNDADKAYKEEIKKIDDLLRDASKDKDSSAEGIKLLNLRHAGISTEQELVTTLLSTFISVYKWKIKECRAVFARAAAFNEKLVKENTELEDAIDDVEHGIIDDLFENEMFA